MTGMDEVELLLVERACARLMTEYSEMVDFGNASKLADLFTEDGVWKADELVLRGREEIRAHFLKREKVVRRVSRHYITNTRFGAVSATEAEAVSYFLNFRHDREEGDLSLPVPAEVPKYSGEYRDLFRLTDDGWRFAVHHVDTTFLRIRGYEPKRRG